MKGDSVTVLVKDAVMPVTITASKAGRTVRHQTRTRNAMKWLDVDELTRHGGPTGNSLSVRLEAVVAVEVRRLEEPSEPRVRKPRVRMTIENTGPGLFEPLSTGFVEQPEPATVGHP